MSTSPQTLPLQAPSGIASFSAELLALVLSHATDDDLRKVQPVSRIWHDVAYRLCMHRIGFHSPSSARRFVASHRERFSSSSGHIVSLATGSSFSIRGYTISAHAVLFLRDLVDLAPSLQSLTIGSDVAIPAQTLASIWHSRPTLRHLRLRCHVSSLDRPTGSSSPSSLDSFLAACLVSAGDHPHFETLELGGRSDLSDAGLESLLDRYGSAIKTLELSDCHRLSADAIRAIARSCPGLEDLTLRRADGILSPPPLTDVPSDPLADGNPFEDLARGCPRLRRLTLQELPSALPTTRSFSHLPHLTSLTLIRCSLRSSFLAFLPSLRHLVLASCKLTGPVPVDRWTELEHLSVLGSTLTVGQVKRLVEVAKRLKKVSIDGIGPHLAPFALRPRLMTAQSSGTFDFDHSSLLSRSSSSDLLSALTDESSLVSPDPTALFWDANLLSSSVPSSVVVELFSRSKSLQSLALFGCQDDDDGPTEKLIFKSSSSSTYRRVDWGYGWPVLGWVRTAGTWIHFAERLARGMLLLPPTIDPRRQRTLVKGIVPGGARMEPEEVEALKVACPSLISIWV